MSKMKKKMLRCLYVVVLSMLIGTQAFSPVLALNEKELNLYWQNSIFFYDPYACNDGDTTPGDSPNGTYSGEEIWDGSCTGMTSSRIAWLSKVLSPLQSAASKNGIPWELIAGQTFQESGGGAKEACNYNPLGLKAKSGHATCSNGFARFNSYEEAFQYYIDSIVPIRNLKNKYPNDPYSALSYIQYGTSSAYASCDSEKYPQCVGHMGEPTPGYVNSVSSIICGIQKWAKDEGVAISSVTWSDYVASSDDDDAEELIELEDGTGAVYCIRGEKTNNEEEPEYEQPEFGDLVDFVKKWAWPTYHAPVYTDRMPAYADYIDNVAVYKGGGDKGIDCGAFVANIMRASGWDSNYVQSGTTSQWNYLRQNWRRVSTSSLRLGDVGIKSGHVILYVGDISGFGSNTASASLGERAPMAGADRNLEQYTWYRRP